MTGADYDIFIAGETIDLVVPTPEAIEREGWYSWFNDPETTRYTEHGLFPNTPQKQREFLDACHRPGSDRLVLLIRPKDSDRCIGVTSLSGINWLFRSGQVAVILGGKQRGAGALFRGMEAKARMAEHAFTGLGLERVWGAQARPLAEWQRYQSLFGFQVEGVLRRAFRRGQNAHDLVVTSCMIEDYQAVIEKRGLYWPGRKQLLDLMRHIPKDAENPVDAADKALQAAAAAVAATLP